jgi:hypothetical protein
MAAWPKGVDEHRWPRLMSSGGNVLGDLGFAVWETLVCIAHTDPTPELSHLGFWGNGSKIQPWTVLCMS